MSDPPVESEKPGSNPDKTPQVDQSQREQSSLASDQGTTIQLTAEDIAALKTMQTHEQGLEQTDRVKTILEDSSKGGLLVQIDLAGLSDKGRKRQRNEDSFVIQQPAEREVLEKKGVLFAVADGLGGHNAGDVASSLAVERLVELYYNNHDASIIGALQQAYLQVNATVYERSQQTFGSDSGMTMGTTLVAGVLWADGIVLANVGDSRAYQIDARSRTIRQVTTDHSWVAEQVSLGKMTASEAEHHHMRNLITRAIGQETQITTDIYPVIPERGDIFILCSDGLHGLVKPEEMLSEATQKSATEATRSLVDLANSRGGPDNITVIILKLGYE